MNFEKLDKYMEDLANHGVPAGDILVFKSHEQIYRKTVGHRDYELKEAARPTDMYNIFSNSKLFLVVSIMQLVERGEISLEDKLSDYIPAYKEMYYKTRNGTAKATTPITLYHLITMTSGLGYDAMPAVNALLGQNLDASTLEIITALAKEPLNFNPGERWKYGRSHDVLAAVIEVKTGMSYGEYLKKNIMDPLGMKHTTFDFESPYVQENISAYYSYDGVNQKEIRKENKGTGNWGRKMESAGGGLYSNCDDYILLVDALANGGIGKNGYRVLSEESIEKIKTPQLNVLMQGNFIASHLKIGYSYGLGVRTLIDKGYGARTPIGEFAWDAMTGGYGLVDTENHIAVIYMQNVENCTYAWRNIFPETRDLIYEALDIE